MYDLNLLKPAVGIGPSVHLWGKKKKGEKKVTTVVAQKY